MADAASETAGCNAGCNALCPDADGITPKASYRIGTRCDLPLGHSDHHRVYYMGDNQRLTSWTWWTDDE